MNLPRIKRDLKKSGYRIEFADTSFEGKDQYWIFQKKEVLPYKMTDKLFLEKMATDLRNKKKKKNV